LVIAASCAGPSHAAGKIVGVIDDELMAVDVDGADALSVIESDVCRDCGVAGLGPGVTVMVVLLPRCPCQP